MAFALKAVGYGLGALIALGGVLLIAIGATTSNADATRNGWTLVALSVGMWVFSIALRKL